MQDIKFISFSIIMHIYGKILTLFVQVFKTGRKAGLNIFLTSMSYIVKRSKRTVKFYKKKAET